MRTGTTGPSRRSAVRHRRVVEAARTAGPAALEATVLRLRSLEALDVALSLATSGRENDFRAWSQHAQAATRGGQPTGDGLDPSWGAVLAQILARSPLRAAEDAVALSIYRDLVDRFGPEYLEPREAQVYGQLLLGSGALQELRAFLPHLAVPTVIRSMLLADLEREAVLSGQKPLAAWYDALRQLVGGPPGFWLPERNDPFRFDELRSRTTSSPADGPLITVVMPVYEPDAGFMTAVRSIISQTWRNLEVLIVDDASSGASRRRFAEVAALDERIRILTKPRNGGTYSARNTALAAARGRFITGQDADDWSHPERLERQVRPLLDDRSLIATLSGCLRVTDDLRASWLRASGSSPTRVNSSSLMFRRTEVMHRMGYYDRVRKGADSEFIFRMRAVFGRAAVAELPECLALVRLAEGSLSRSDFLPGWHHESRVWYREMYTYWHGTVRTGRDAFVPVNGDARPFPVPRGVASAGPEALVLDDVLIADLRCPDEAQGQLLGEARRRAAMGRRVGLAHLESFDRFEAQQRPFQPAVVAAIFAGEFPIVEWSREVVADVALFWPAELSQYHSDLRPPWRIRLVGLVAAGTMSISDLSETVQSWSACTDWAVANLAPEHGVDLMVPTVDRSGGTAPSGRPGAGLLSTGRLGFGEKRREVIVFRCEPAGRSAPGTVELVEAFEEQGATVNVCEVSEAVAREAVRGPVTSETASARRTTDRAPEPFRVTLLVTREGRYPAETTATAVAERVLARDRAVILLRDDPRSGGILHPLGGVPPRELTVTAPPPTSSTDDRFITPPDLPPGAREHGIEVLPFVAVAARLAPAVVPGWSSRTVGGIHYWFPERGVVAVTPVGDDYRLQTPSCVVVIRRPDGDRGHDDWWTESTAVAVVEPSRMLGALTCGHGAPVLAVHAGHTWTIHWSGRGAPTGCVDTAGRIRAIAADGATLSAFLSALRSATETAEELRKDPASVALLGGRESSLQPGSSPAGRFGFSTLAGSRFVPIDGLHPALVIGPMAG